MGIPLPLVTCSDVSFTLSQYSGNVTLTLHCPGDLIQPSLWNDRQICLEYQLCYLNLLIQQINNQNTSIANSLMSQYNNVVSELSKLQPANIGQPVFHEYFNVIWDHINLAYNVLTNFFSIVWGYGSSQPAQVIPYEDQILYVINNIPKKKIMDLMKASDWNALTQALYAIDKILQFIKQNWIIPATTIVFGSIIFPKSSSIQLSTVTVATVSSSIGWKTG